MERLAREKSYTGEGLTLLLRGDGVFCPIGV